MLDKIHYYYICVLNYLIKKSFPLWENLEFHITPNHYYEPIPDTRTLKNNLWSKKSELIGIKIDDDSSLDLLYQFKKFKEEYDNFSRSESLKRLNFDINNKTYGPVDAGVYYSMIRLFKPKRIIEIGSGNSTYVAAEALLKNEKEYGSLGNLTAIEPYPNLNLKKGFPGLSKLVQSKIEDVDLSKFSKLKKNDILFIDSSHVLKIGNDVHYEYLEILPRLNKGVIVHIHDIFFPFEYPKEWIIKHKRFWNEQYLLQSFLAFNNAFEVLWGGTYMHIYHPDKLEDTFNSYKTDNRNIPVSFWIRKK